MRTSPLETARRLIGAVLPRLRVVQAEALVGGFCNTNIKVRCDRDTLVLRIHERDPTACEKEIALLDLVRPTVPVPTVIAAAPAGVDAHGPFVVLAFVEGVMFAELRHSGHAVAIGEASASIGRTLAAIGQYTFDRPGRLGTREGRLQVGEQLVPGADPIPTFLDACLARPALISRVDSRLRERLHGLVWSWAGQLRDATDEQRLVHCDYGTRNLILRRLEGSWSVAGVLDWEFAASGSPLWDLGHFLRYDGDGEGRRSSEPQFSLGFREGGGSLPDGWRHLARLLDLVALCETLTWETLPDDVAAETLRLVRATAEMPGR